MFVHRQHNSGQNNDTKVGDKYFESVTDCKYLKTTQIKIARTNRLNSTLDLVNACLHMAHCLCLCKGEVGRKGEEIGVRDE